MPLLEVNQKRPRPGDHGLVKSSKTHAHIIRELHQALTSNQRKLTIEYVTKQLKELRHAGPEVYDAILKHGIIPALCLHLKFMSNRQQDESEQEVVEGICSILSCVFKHCSLKARNEAILAEGPELLTHLMNFDHCHFYATLPLLDIFSQTTQGAWLLLDNGVVRAISREIPDNQTLENATLVKVLGLLKDLSYFAEERRHEIAENSCLLSQLAKVACAHGASEKAMERLSAILRNRAVSPSSRPGLAQNFNLLGGVIRMSSTTNRQVLRNVLSYFLSLCQEAESRVVVVLHGDGAILNVLKRLVQFEGDPITRRRAIRVLRLLICESSGSFMVYDSALLASITKVALRDGSEEVRREASDTLLEISALVKAPMAQHSLVLDALSQLCLSPIVSLEELSRALEKQAKTPNNRLPFAQRRFLLDSLAHIALSAHATRMAKAYACSAIYELTKDPSICEKIATCSILDALVQNAESQVFGIKALVNLAAVPSNRRGMAVHYQLVKTLVQHAASSGDSELKREVKIAILSLVTEL